MVIEVLPLAWLYNKGKGAFARLGITKVFSLVGENALLLLLGVEQLEVGLVPSLLGLAKEALVAVLGPAAAKITSSVGSLERHDREGGNAFVESR